MDANQPFYTYVESSEFLRWEGQGSCVHTERLFCIECTGYVLSNERKLNTAESRNGTLSKQNSRRSTVGKVQEVTFRLALEVKSENL